MNIPADLVFEKIKSYLLEFRQQGYVPSYILIKSKFDLSCFSTKKKDYQMFLDVDLHINDKMESDIEIGDKYSRNVMKRIL